MAEVGRLCRVGPGFYTHEGLTDVEGGTRCSGAGGRVGVLAPLRSTHPIWGSDRARAGAEKPWGEISPDGTTEENDSSGPQLFHRFQFSRRPESANHDPRTIGSTHFAARSLALMSEP